MEKDGKKSGSCGAVQQRRGNSCVFKSDNHKCKAEWAWYKNEVSSTIIKFEGDPSKKCFK